MIKLTVDEKEIEVEEGCTVLQACEIAGEEIPRFCCLFFYLLHILHLQKEELLVLCN